MRRRILAGALAAAMLAGCSSAGPANPIDGLITGIEGRTLTLRTVGGDTMEFEIADPTVPVDHLRVHQGQKLPVRITWTRRGGGAPRCDDDRRCAASLTPDPCGGTPG